MKHSGTIFSTILCLLTSTFLFFNGCGNSTGETVTTSPPTRIQNPLFQDITPAEAHSIITLNAGQTNFVILDVRTPEEFTSGHIQNAMNVDYHAPTFKDAINKFKKNDVYLVYCRTGHRSDLASDIMKNLGFTQIYNMTGGITDWTALGFPVVK